MRRPLQAFVAALALLSCTSAPHTATVIRKQHVARPAGPDGVGPLVAAASPVRAPMLDATRIPVGSSPVRGRADALVTVVVFSDFQCPFCSRVAPTLNALSERYGDDLRIVWKNNPLPFHDNAMPAAEAAMAVYEQGGAVAFWAFHDMLFDNQRSLSRDDLEQYAARVGVDLASFRAALDAHAHRPRIEADMALARALGANGTPSFFINGTAIAGAQPVERFVTTIDAVLARARTVEPRSRAYAAMVADPVASPDPPPAPARRRPAQPDPAQVLRVPVGSSPSLGPASALVTMVVFSDFQCPFCARVEPTLARLRERYGARLRVVWKNEALPFHNNARPAAEAAMEALAQRGSQGFWQMHDLLFENQQNLTREDLEQYATRLELDMTRFRAALDEHTHRASIDADHALAQRLEANGTPHFFINGVRLVGAQPEARFTDAIDAALATTQAFMRAHPGTTRANVYERLMAAADTEVRRAPSAGDDADGDAPDENRVYTLRPAARAPSFGPANARVVIEHFTDFQCPFCARAAPTLAEVRARYGDRVRIVWRDYPLPFHPHAMLAAEAAREAFVQGGAEAYARYRDALFENQQSLAREDLERYAAQLGLDVARFRAALDAHTHQAHVRADVAAADATGAQIGTPAFFVNGRFFAGALPFEEFQRRIDQSLAARR